MCYYVYMLPLARVFARKTVYCPDDEHAYYGPPGPATPRYEEVHVSCTFTWDKPRAVELAQAWARHGLEVKLGGPAYRSPAVDFIPGRYVRRGITFTTRGCPNRCSFCFVPNIEGPFLELDTIAPGNIIQDNNLLACSPQHWNKVMCMLSQQRGICFKGGLEARRLTDQRLGDLATIRRHIAELWLACDRPTDLWSTVSAIRRLAAAGFPRWKVRCYVIIGKDIHEEEHRLRELFWAGSLPFAQLYKADPPIEYDKAWRAFQKTWCRPAASKDHMKNKIRQINKLWDCDQ